MNRPPLHIVLLVAVAIPALVASLVLAAYYGIKYPAAGFPAAFGAILGAWRFFRVERVDVSPQDRPAQALRMFGACIWPGIAFGALGYAVLAAGGIGVPDSTAPVAWRVFGGAVFGALAGVVAGWAVACIARIFWVMRVMRSSRRNHGAA